MEKGKADVDNDVIYNCFLINTKENIYNNRNSHQGDKTEISWCCVFQISQRQGAGKKKRTKKKTRRRFNACAYNYFDFENIFVCFFSVVEKNEGSKLSSTWRPANDYVNLKVGEERSLSKCGGILRIHNISLLPNIFSVILAKNIECFILG